MNAIWTDLVDEIERYIEGVLLAQVKMQAVKLLNQQIQKLVSGANGSGILYISNWQQYLFEVPAQQNALYVDSLLSQTTRGKCSGSNYQSTSSGKFGTNFLSTLCGQAQSSVSAGIPEVTIDQYSSNPTGAMASGNFRVWNAFFASPSNNPLSYPIMIGSAARSQYAQDAQLAQTKAIANQGYNSLEKDGIVVTPGRTIADIVANVETLGNNIITSASNPAELVSGVISSVANQAMNQMLQRGFDQASTALNKQTDKINQQVRAAGQTVNKELGPASQYLQGANQVISNVNAANGRYGGKPAKGCAGTASGYGGC